MNDIDNQIRVYSQDEILVISIQGNVTYERIPELKEYIEMEMVSSIGYILELKEVGRIDSTGLGLIVTIAKHLIPNDGRMVIVCKDQRINGIFRISKLDSVFKICESVDKAKEELASGSEDDYIIKVKGY